MWRRTSKPARGAVGSGRKLSSAQRVLQSHASQIATYRPSFDERIRLERSHCRRFTSPVCRFRSLAVASPRSNAGDEVRLTEHAGSRGRMASPQPVGDVRNGGLGEIGKRVPVRSKASHVAAGFADIVPIGIDNEAQLLTALRPASLL